MIKFIIRILGFLVKLTLGAFALALLLIFLATLTTAVGLDLAIPNFFTSLPDQLQFLDAPLNALRSFGGFVGEKLQFLGSSWNATRSVLHSAGDFFLLWGHRIMVYAIIGGMIYFILSILKNW